ncbi:MAG: hypothetical protein K940chlam9_00960, partial [Chlamydiae bacterium]|nr:hypothetical protein [Chlamydiota bacterium]
FLVVLSDLALEISQEEPRSEEAPPRPVRVMPPPNVRLLMQFEIIEKDYWVVWILERLFSIQQFPLFFFQLFC